MTSQASSERDHVIVVGSVRVHRERRGVDAPASLKLEFSLSAYSTRLCTGYP
jgi:hypothetical protein